MTPEYIIRHWTEELLVLMFLKRAKRYKRIADAREGKTTEYEIVSEDTLFDQIGYKPKQV